MGFIDNLFKSIGQQPSQGHATNVPAITEFRYIPGELYYEAEALRKAGHLDEAEKKYLGSIRAGEADRCWRETGAAPAMYEALAKLYYHTNRDEKALKVLDRYLAFQENIGRSSIEMKMLRERMSKGDFRRMKQKGWNYEQPVQTKKKKPAKPTASQEGICNVREQTFLKVTGKGKARYLLEDGVEAFGEEAALKFYEAEGYRGLWSENHYWWEIMSLLYWDIIFMPIRDIYEPQAFAGMPNVPQMAVDMPRDLFNPGFYKLREVQIVQRAREILSSNVPELLTKSFNQNFKKPCRLIENWDKHSLDTLLFATFSLSPDQINKICVHILEDVSVNRSGLPDLFLASGRQPFFSEVKTARETVKENQQAWHKYLAYEVRVPVEFFVIKPKKPT